MPTPNLIELIPPKPKPPPHEDGYPPKPTEVGLVGCVTLGLGVMAAISLFTMFLMWMIL